MPSKQTTRPEVLQLETMLHPQPGDLISYAALEEILAPLTRQEARFRTICGAWRRHIAAWRHAKMVVERGIGLRVLHEHERLEPVRKSFDRSFRLIERTTDDADDIRTTTLTTAQADDVHLTRTSLHRIHQVMVQERTRIQHTAPPPLPLDAPPQRAALFLTDQEGALHAQCPAVP